MKVKNIILGSLVAPMFLLAGGDIAPTEPVMEEVSVDTWNYSASLNMWGAGITGQTASQGEIDSSFKDILDNLKMTFMGTVGVKKEKWGIEADFVYLNVGNYIEETEFIHTFGLKSWVITPIVTYQILDTEQWKLDILAGARYLSMEPSINNVSTSGHVWDGIVGLKGSYDFNEQWFMPFQFDIGSGDTDVTWQAFAGIGYKYENFDLIAGYRQLDWTFEDGGKGGKVFNDLTISGPIVMAKFNF